MKKLINTSFDFKCGSHSPVNYALLNIFNVSGVLELGMGLHSTPIFAKKSPYTISIECDKQWIDKLDEQGIATSDRHKIVHHSLPSQINRHTYHIPKELQKESIKLYQEHIDERINYLFVDCYSAFRLSALILYEQFDIIVYHDADISNDDYYRYGYHQFQPKKQYSHFVDESIYPATGFLIKNTLMDQYDDFIKNHNIQLDKYCSKFYDFKFEQSIKLIPFHKRVILF